MRKLDLFAVQVQLSYKGERSFNTALGGFCSLLLVLCFLAYAAYELNDNLSNEVLHNSQESIYAPISTDFILPTQNSTLAVEILNGENLDDPQLEISKYLRVTFTLADEQIPARFCTDVYAE